MKALKFILTIFFLSTYSFTLFAQSTNQLTIHFDKSFYVLGERIWYKIYLTSDQKVGELVEVQIAKTNGALMAHQRLLLDNGHAHGDFRIPLSWEEGLYSFNVLIKTEGDKALHFQQVIPIFNDMLGDSEASMVSNESYSRGAQKEGPLDIQVNTNKTVYSPREKISLNITVKDQNGQPIAANLSLAVKDQHLVPEIQNSSQINEIDYTFASAAEGQLLFTGNATDETTGMAKRMNLVAIYEVESNKVTWGGSNSSGLLSFAMTPFYGDYDIQIRNFDVFNDDAAFQIKLDNQIPVALLKAESNPGLLERTPAIQQYLQWSRERKRINKMMRLDTIDYSIQRVSGIDKTPPDRTYPIEDYVAFNSLKEFVDEVILPIKWKERKGQNEFRLLDPNTKMWHDKAPLFLLDGYIVEDQEKILGLDIENVRQIDLFIDHNTLTGKFGILGGNGVMAVYTKGNGAKLEEVDLANTFTLKGLHRANEFKAGAKKNNDKLPDFRSLLYWNPSIQTDENGRATIEFYNSDDSSDFLIEIYGQSAEKLGQSTAIFKTTR